MKRKKKEVTVLPIDMEEEPSNVNRSPYWKFLKFFRIFGGFPLDINTILDRTKSSTVDFIPKFDILRPLLIPLFILSGNISNGIFITRMSGMDICAYIDYLVQEMDFFRTDLLTTSILTMGGIISSSVAYLTIVWSRKEITEAYSKIFEVSSRLPSINFSLSSKEHKAAVSAIIANLTMSLLSSFLFFFFIWEMKSLVPTDMQSREYLTFSFIFCCSLFVSYSHPLFSGIVFLFRDLTLSYRRILMAWKESMLLNPKTTKATCAALSDLATSINKALSGPLLALFTFQLINGICCVYGVFVFVGSSNSNQAENPQYDFTKWIYLMSASYACFATITVGVLNALGNIGSSLTEESVEAAKLFEDLHVFGGMDDKAAAAMLADRLRKSSRMRPFDAFEISHGNNLMRANSLITFIIILLQFRVAEQ